MTDSAANPDPAEERWCAQRRRDVSYYLRREGVMHGAIADWPAWHIFPYVSVWAIESVKSAGWVGWWVICGDLPTDYVSSSGLRDPRSAVGAIAQHWLAAVPYLERGDQPPNFTVGRSGGAQDLASLLQSRADLLARWVADDTVW